MVTSAKLSHLINKIYDNYHVDNSSIWFAISYKRNLQIAYY